MISAGFLVRVTGFEPAASWSQTEAENFFRTFLAIFYRFRSYSVTLLPSFESPFPPVPRASVVIHVVKKRFPTKKDGKRFLCSKCLRCNSGQRVMQVVSGMFAVQKLRRNRQRIQSSSLYALNMVICHNQIIRNFLICHGTVHVRPYIGTCLDKYLL